MKKIRSEKFGAARASGPFNYYTNALENFQRGDYVPSLTFFQLAYSGDIKANRSDVYKSLVYSAICLEKLEADLRFAIRLYLQAIRTSPYRVWGYLRLLHLMRTQTSITVIYSLFVESLSVLFLDPLHLDWLMHIRRARKRRLSRMKL